MDPRDAAALRGEVGELQPVDEQEGYNPGKFEVRRSDTRAQARHTTCRPFVLDLDHDPDARAAALYYAARVAARRPALSRDLRAMLDELRPGEAYVQPEDVDLGEGGRA
jgi:hypothetical protein